jgi:hypothetical protein
LAPRIARRADGSEVALDALALGDALLIRPGEAIPTDGIVLTGTSFLDQSMFTGEPMPVARGPGDAVLGGSVNQSGALTIRVDKLGGDTLLAGVIRMVEEAQNAQMPIQALVDRITLWFVPAVMAVAALTFALWLAFGPSLAVALTHAVAVLIIACPCAMGLATPTSIMVGMGRAASLGVLFRHGDALQRQLPVAHQQGGGDYQAQADQQAVDQHGGEVLMHRQWHRQRHQQVEQGGSAANQQKAPGLGGRALRGPEQQGHDIEDAEHDGRRCGQLQQQDQQPDRPHQDDRSPGESHAPMSSWACVGIPSEIRCRSML